MSTNMTEINKLIDEIEEERRVIRLEQKNKRKKQYYLKKREEKKREKKIFFIKTTLVTLYFTALASKLVSSSIKEEYSLFSNREVIVSDECIDTAVSLLEEELGITISNNKEDYLLLNAIRENDNINEKDKKQLYQLIDFIKENDYLNRERVYETLLEVDIIRTEKKEDVQKIIVAEYTPINNTIALYDQEELTKEEKKKNEQEVLAHEGIHAIIYTQSLRTIPRCLNEGMTDLLTNEYYTSHPFLNNRYSYEIAFVKMLCEIIGEEKVLEAYTTDKPDILYKELSKYTAKSKTEIEKSILIMDKALIEFYNNKEEKANAKEEQKEMELKPVSLTKERKETLDFFDKCIENKIEKNIGFDPAIYQYNKLLLSTVFLEYPIDNYYEIWENYSPFYSKAYFCEELKETGKNKHMIKNKEKIHQ